MNRILILCCVLCLSACDGLSTSSSDNVQINFSNSANRLTTSTPVELRGLQTGDLSLWIKVGDTANTYSGKDFPDHEWNVDINVVENQSYDVVTQWYSKRTLLLEEYGSFYTDPTQPDLSLDLDFISAGYPRFDDDCDNIPNIDEVLTGSDPNADANVGQSLCPTPAPEVEFKRENVYAWIARRNPSFSSNGYGSRATSFEQHVQLRQHDEAVKFSFGSQVVADLKEGESVRNNARILLKHNPQAERTIVFSILRASDSTPADIQGAQCFAIADGDAGIGCSVPFDWQERRSYSLRLEEVSSTTWQARVVDSTSGKVQTIGNIETHSNENWTHSQTLLTIETALPTEECSDAVPFTSIRYSEGLVNNSERIQYARIAPGDCVAAGAGWSDGTRTLDQMDVEYALNLGVLSNPNPAGIRFSD